MIDVQPYLTAHLDDYLRDLTELAAIDSGSDDKAGVDAVVDWFEARFRKIGGEIERDRQSRLGDNLIARWRGSGSRSILLLGHSDTVYPAGTARARPLSIEGDVIQGPGTCDMKAGLLSGVHALEALQSVGWGQFGQITFLIVSDEETADRASVPLIQREGATHDAVLTLEAARENGDIVTARKGVRWFTVEAHGKSAHAGVEPEKGRSATLAIAKFIVAANRLNDHVLGMTVNCGRISGGASPSIVVDQASARFDLRAWTEFDLDELQTAFLGIVLQDLVPDVRLRITLEPGSDCPAMQRTTGVARLEQLAIFIANDLGFELHGAETGGASDISYAGHSGTPGLDGLGPIGGLDHGPDEYILLSSIVPRQALLARLLVAIATSQN